jgi:hypothetical protein
MLKIEFLSAEEGHVPHIDLGSPGQPFPPPPPLVDYKDLPRLPLAISMLPAARNIANSLEMEEIQLASVEVRHAVEADPPLGAAGGPIRSRPRAAGRGQARERRREEEERCGSSLGYDHVVPNTQRPGADWRTPPQWRLGPGTGACGAVPQHPESPPAALVTPDDVDWDDDSDIEVVLEEHEAERERERIRVQEGEIERRRIQEELDGERFDEYERAAARSPTPIDVEMRSEDSLPPPRGAQREGGRSTTIHPTTLASRLADS